MRTSDIKRVTKETEIKATLLLEGSGTGAINSGCGFLDHMLQLFAHHGRFDLKIACRGDKNVDYHHSVEDIGIVLGQAFLQALGDKRGICRYGSALIPMDEALVQVALDISGRSHLSYGLNIPTEKVGDFDTQLVEEFLQGFCRELGLTLHVRQLAGDNAHHIIEAAFKALARSLSRAVAIDERMAGEIPSTKGIL